MNDVDRKRRIASTELNELMRARYPHLAVWQDHKPAPMPIDAPASNESRLAARRTLGLDDDANDKTSGRHEGTCPKCAGEGCRQCGDSGRNPES